MGPSCRVRRTVEYYLSCLVGFHRPALTLLTPSWTTSALDAFLCGRPSFAFSWQLSPAPETKTSVLVHATSMVRPVGSFSYRRAPTMVASEASSDEDEADDVPYICSSVLEAGVSPSVSSCTLLSSMLKKSRFNTICSKKRKSWCIAVY